MKYLSIKEGKKVNYYGLSPALQWFKNVHAAETQTNTNYAKSWTKQIQAEKDV